MNIHRINEEELHRLIGRYFDGETSIDEERLLRRLLATEPGFDSSEAEEAKAVLGIGALGRVAGRRSRRRSRRYMIAAAASIALLFGLALTALLPFSPGFECYAFVDGQLIDNPEAIESLIGEDLRSISEARAGLAESIDLDFSEFSEIFNNSNE